jgi:hypothetical protein
MYTVFHEASSSNNDGLQQKICPMCKNKSISNTLAKDEGYTIGIGAKRGLEMEFSRRRK